MTRPHWLRPPPEIPVWLGVIIGWVAIAILVFAPLLVRG